MSKEKQCECCHEWWYGSDVKEDLCPNCYAYFKQLKQQLAEKNEELRKYKSYKTDDERIKDLTNLYSQYKEENNQLRKELKDKDFALECKERDIKAIEKTKR